MGTWSKNGRDGVVGVDRVTKRILDPIHEVRELLAFESCGQVYGKESYMFTSSSMGAETLGWL
jgi:hypothetical protein